MGSPCNMCPRRCNVDRSVKVGFCGQKNVLKAARAAAHFWEEPCISGAGGSGTVFFSGCNLRCVFCQNSQISSCGFGKEISVEKLKNIYARLIDLGADNINLVTPTHFSELIIESLDEKLPVPVIWNSGGYDSAETIRKLNGKIDIYMPDFKYINADIAEKYSSAPDYPVIASSAITEMFNQVGKCRFDSDGMLQRGVLIRHLILPGNVENTLDVIDWVSGNFKSGDVLFSLMRQYTPPAFDTGFEELSHRVADDEYEKCENYMYLAGIEDGFVQDISSAESEYTPPFNLEGID